MEALSMVPAAAAWLALEELDGGELQRMIARAQGLLLDRPAPRGGTDGLAVEIVEPAEGRLLGRYRALAPLAQCQLLAHAAYLAHGSGTWAVHSEVGIAVSPAG